jgi:hypothetical protein
MQGKNAVLGRRNAKEAVQQSDELGTLGSVPVEALLVDAGEDVVGDTDVQGWLVPRPW